MRSPFPTSLLFLSFRAHCFSPHLFNRHCPLALFAAQLQQSSVCKDVATGTAIHAIALKLGYGDLLFLNNHLLNFYCKCQLIQNAHRLFDEMPQRNVVSWTALMAGYVHCGQGYEALQLFAEAKKGGAWVNAFTFATAINACSALADVHDGLKLHGQAEIEGYVSNLVVGSALVDMYGKCGLVDHARRVFDEMAVKNIVTWTSMISICAQNGRGPEAIQLFAALQARNLVPNEYTFATVVNACASLGCLGAGKLSHALIIRRHCDTNEVVSSALVDMYPKCGCLNYAVKVFRRVADPKVIQWTSIIMGHAQHGLGHAGLQLFDEMLARGIQPNDVTLVGVLYACSHSGLVNRGKEVFDSMYRVYGVIPDTKHYTCMVDMLGRAGRLDDAEALIETMPMAPDVLLWGALLSASRSHGRIELAIKAAENLIELNQQLDSTYVTLSNMYASVDRWSDAVRIRREMKIRGICKEPGCSWIEVKSKTYVFFAGDQSCVHEGQIITVLQELEKKMREKGYVADRSLVFHNVEEEAKEEILGFHSERLALAFGLINTAEGSVIRILKNLRICSDCHEAFKLLSEIVSRDLIVRDVNRFHHFGNGSCSCGDYW
ncbi:pentatricopeptide repeat-containing protein At4g15720 isoform X1 [Nymphaea colorata]|nr:pentatricopeptide repeat-containing protein At4g15720 isoform X1 [Nymphaea colorata]